MLKSPMQLDPSSTGTSVSLINGQVEHPLPLNGLGVIPKYVAISVDVTTPVSFKVGAVGVDSNADPHGIISLESGMIVLNVTGMKAIDFSSGFVGIALVVPLANQ